MTTETNQHAERETGELDCPICTICEKHRRASLTTEEPKAEWPRWPDGSPVTIRDERPWPAAEPIPVSGETPEEEFWKWYRSDRFAALDRDHAHMATWVEGRKPLLQEITRLRAAQPSDEQVRERGCCREAREELAAIEVRETAERIAAALDAAAKNYFETGVNYLDVDIITAELAKKRSE